MKTSFLILLLVATCIGEPQKVNEPVEVRLDSRIDGKEINVTHLKPAGQHLKEAILFIHGASFPSALASGFKIDGFSWMDDLANAGFDVFALDLLGYGKSDRYDYMSELVENVEEEGSGKQVVRDIDIAVNYILEELGLKKVHLIGHSWGATVSGHYASLFPQKVDNLVLFAPFTQRDGGTNWDKTEELFKELTPAQRVKQFTNQIPEGQEMTLAKDVLNQWGKQWLASDPTSKSRNPNSVRYPRAWERDLYDCWNGDCFFEPADVKSPTLLIRGEWDTAFSFADAERLFLQLEKAKTKRYYVIDKATHVLHLEKNRLALYEAVRLFLKSN